MGSGGYKLLTQKFIWREGRERGGGRDGEGQTEAENFPESPGELNLVCP